MSEELKKEWSDEFDEKFNAFPDNPVDYVVKKEVIDEIKSFISFLLAKQQEEFVKMVGGLKYQPYDSTVDPFRQDGYSACIADIKSKLESEIK
jgi:hypothetical protein